MTLVLPTKLTAAAGGAGGSWYVLLEGLAALVHEVQPEIVVKVVEGGGVENHARVGAGELPMAILNPPMTVAALSGVPPYAGAFPDLRVGLTNLTVNHLQLVVDRAVPIASLEDWVARAYPLRIPVDRVGTVDRLVFELALAHIGLSVERLEAWGRPRRARPELPRPDRPLPSPVKPMRSGSSWASRRLPSRRPTRYDPSRSCPCRPPS